MRNFKYITQTTIILMALCLPFLVHASDVSDNSATMLPGEGNVQCTDYSANKVILSMDTSNPVSSGTLTGPDYVDDSGKTTPATVSYQITNLTSLSFGIKNLSTVPIDYAVIKSKKEVIIAMYPFGGVHWDKNIALKNNDVISAISLCYGLGNQTPDPAPVNKQPELDQIDDQMIMWGNLLEFDITAEDDLLPDDLLDIISDTLPPGDALLTRKIPNTKDNTTKYTTWTFTWTPTSADIGVYSVTFTATDAFPLIDDETISITVNDHPPAPLVTPSCDQLSLDKDDGTTLDNTGIDCSGSDRALVCNFQLDMPNFGVLDDSGSLSEYCCYCNDGGSQVLERCDASLPAGSEPSLIGPPCMLTIEEKLARQEDLLPAEVPIIIELNNDPIHCVTANETRYCFLY